MTEHPNAEPISRAFDAFARGDMAAMRSLVAEDTVWHIPGAAHWPVIITAERLCLKCSAGWCRHQREPSLKNSKIF
jgi:ketosteroid isomerase-like protein